MLRKFPGSPVVKTQSCNAEGAGSIPGIEANIPYIWCPEPQNIKKEKRRSNIVTNSTKTLKMVHIKKMFEKTKKQ